METLLEKYKGDSRILIIFTPSVEKDIYIWQQRELEENVLGMIDRDLVVAVVNGSGRSFEGEEEISEEAVKELRNRFKVKDHEYVAFLLDKDSQLKYRDDKPVAMEDIFSIIDAMPLRKQELEDRRRMREG